MDLKVFELSDSTKVKIAEDVLRNYFKAKDKDSINYKKVRKAWENIQEKEPWYSKGFELLYSEGLRIDWICDEHIFCARRTFYNKRDKMLLELFNEVMAGIDFPAVFFLYGFISSLQFVVGVITICRPLSKVCRNSIIFISI